jgi:outer membrane protein assembly factor BamD (BamD/ComL family)
MGPVALILLVCRILREGFAKRARGVRSGEALVISRLRYSITCALLLGSVVAVGGEPAKPENPLEKARRLAASTDKKDRIQALRWLRALARPGTTSGDEATYRYAGLCLRFHAEGEKTAIKEARAAFEKLAKGAGSRYGLRGKIGLWRVLALEGKRKQAIRGLDRFLGQQTKCERAVEAAYFLGCIYTAAGKKTELADLRNAQRSLSYSLKLYAAVAKYNQPIIARKVIQAKLAGVKRRLWELAAGKLKVLFDRAEKLRKGKKFDAAIKVYRQIRKEFPGHDLSELSGLRVAQCYFGKKQLKKAVANAREFIARDPLGAYRGHAHLLIGDIHLEHFFNVAACESEFRCILDPRKSRPRWVNPERRNLIAYRKLDPRKTPPATAPHKTWKQVLYSAHERVGILEYIRRDYKKAAEHFETSQKIKPTKTYGSNPHQGMAELGEKIRRKEEIVPRVLLAEKAERPKLVLLLASLYIEGWRDGRALGLFKRVAGGEFKEASVNQRAYAQVRVAEAYFYRKNDKQALAALRAFDKKPYALTQFAAGALLQASVVLARLQREKEADKYMKKCYTLYPAAKEAEYAFYQMAFGHYLNSDPKTALRWYKEFRARYPNSEYVKRGHVTTFIRALESKMKKRHRSNAG